MDHNQSVLRRNAIAMLVASIGASAVTPAFADAEVDALRRELAEQRELISRLLANQNVQKTAIEKIEARPAAPAANTSSGSLPQGLNIYGTLDVNVASNNSGNGRKTTIGSGGMSASSIGIKGQKDIGKELRVVGEVEIGVDLSTGVAGNGANTNGVNNATPSSGGFLGNGNQLFSRQAYAGVATDSYGQLTLGRQYSGSYIAAAIMGNALGPGFYGSGVTYLPIIGGMPTRLNNSIVYRSPSLAGLSAYITYTVGSENNVNGTTVSGTSRVTDSSGAGWDAALFYRKDKLNAGLTVWDVKNATFAATETGLANKTGYQGVVNYDFGFMKLYGTYVSGKISGGNYENVTKTLSKSSGWSTSAAFPFGNHTVMVSYSELDDQSQLNRDGSLVGIAYTYKIHDSTRLYANYGRQLNNANASYSLLNGGDLTGSVVAAGYNPSGVMVGLNTKF